MVGKQQGAERRYKVRDREAHHPHGTRHPESTCIYADTRTTTKLSWEQKLFEWREQCEEWLGVRREHTPSGEYTLSTFRSSPAWVLSMGKEAMGGGQATLRRTLVCALKIMQSPKCL